MSGEVTTIGPGVVVEGDVTGVGDLVIRGRVVGAVRVAGGVRIEPEGSVQGPVQASDLVVAGRLDGRASATGAIDVLETGRVTGDIVAPRVAIAPGASFRGRVDLAEAAVPVERPPDAPVPRRAPAVVRVVSPSISMKAPSPPPRTGEVRPAPRPPAPPSVVLSRTSAPPAAPPRFAPDADLALAASDPTAAAADAQGPSSSRGPAPAVWRKLKRRE